MSVSRKAIAAALLAQLTSGGQFAKTGRRDRAPEQAALPGKPALYLIKPTENYRYEQKRGAPAVREMEFLAVIYTDVGTVEGAVPADVIDDLLDGLDTAIAPAGSDAAVGRQTLGGLVYDCRIEGDIEFAPGDVQGKGTTLVRLRLIIVGQ